MTSVENIRILLVDDHSIVRTGVKALLNSSFKNNFIKEAWDADSVAEACAGGPFDLIISDLTFSHAHDGSYFIQKILPLFGSWPVILLTMQPPDYFASKFLKMGIRAYVHKESPDFQIVHIIKEVLDKGFYNKNLPFTITETDQNKNPFDALSPREMEVTRLVVRGESLKMISQKLNLHVSTIGTFKTRILEKLKIDSTLELAKIYDKFCPE